VLTLDVNI